MKKSTFTAKNLNEIRKAFNAEFRGFNHCKKFVVEHWDALRELGETNNCLPEHCEASWMQERLNGSKHVQNNVFGRTKKDGTFVARTMWTPGAVLDYLRRAEAVEWAKINKAVKEAKNDK